mmetsp:Transcript_6160/g.10614  ORF Transcript_6160/g.10614 Transcript_6160/m.10614 type:complete len:90 (+) Transcript_6160:67-336(+)
MVGKSPHTGLRTALLNGMMGAVQGRQLANGRYRVVLLNPSADVAAAHPEGVKVQPHNLEFVNTNSPDTSANTRSPPFRPDAHDRPLVSG